MARDRCEKCGVELVVGRLDEADYCPACLDEAWEEMLWWDSWELGEEDARQLEDVDSEDT